MLIIYTITLSSINVLRLFDNSFWVDEGLSINIANKSSVFEVLETVADNGHVPLYYVIMFIGCKFLGYSGFIYHFISAIPYFILIVISITWIRKRFGIVVSLILISLSTLLDCSITYNLEVRMYAWCQLFILLTFLVAYKLYNERKLYQFWLLSIFSSLAIYSHYYALISVGFIYIFLFYYYLKERKRIKVIQIIVSGAAVLILLLPWIAFADNHTGVITNYGNISFVKLNDCIEFIFSSKYTSILFLLFCISFSLWTLYSLRIIVLNQSNINRYQIKIKSPGDYTKKCNTELLWAMSGICAVFGTIILSEVFSYIFYPIVVLRYLYPSFIIIWLIFAISISRLHLCNLWTILIIILLFISGGQNYINTYYNEKLNNFYLEATLDNTKEIDGNSCILTDIDGLYLNIAQVYYPMAKCVLININDIPDIDISYDNWLFLSEPIEDETKDKIYEQNLTIKTISENGFIGTGAVWIYKLQ